MGHRFQRLVSPVNRPPFTQGKNNMSTPQQTLQAIHDEALRIEEDALYSARGHWEAAKPWGHANLMIGIPLTLASAVAGVSAMNDSPKLATTIAFAVSAGSALVTFLAPSQKQQRHADCGNAYKTLHNQARIFRLVECTLSKPLDELLEKLKKLDDTRNTLNAGSPIVPRHAFEAARRGIEAGEADYRADKPLNR
jgi:hypothetical protein